MSDRPAFEHLRVIDLRLVQDRNDRWHLYVEGRRVVLKSPIGERYAEYLAFLVRRVSTPFPPRLWSAIWREKPWGHP